jgi:hypothetical protein
MERYIDKIQPYRQPMVTAIGIFLGFLLNFASGWTKDAQVTHRLRDVVIGVSFAVALASLLVALFRVLRMYHAPDPVKFYRRTLVLFLLGISVPFLAFLSIILEKFVIGFFIPK